MSLHKDVAKFKIEVLSTVERAIELISIDLYTRITDKTPVRTGRARANWNMSAGSVDNTVTTKVVRKNFSTIRGLSPSSDNVVYISNHLSYIYDLEHGKSKQAPNGMVLLSIPETVRWANSKLGSKV